MAGGESRMTGDCCPPEGSIQMRTHAFVFVLSYICGLVALLDRIQLSFSIISTFEHAHRLSR